LGAGITSARGAALARLEAQLAIGELIRRFPRIELAGKRRSNGRINLRSLSDLPVQITG
jgi:cytochrome P450